MAKSRPVRTARGLFPKCCPRVAGPPQINQSLARGLRACARKCNPKVSPSAAVFWPAFGGFARTANSSTVRLCATNPSSPVSPRLQQDFFARSVHDVAPELVGATLLFKGVGGVIVEVEAYHHTDPAAHSFRGQTPRNAVMFGPPGYAYVYRSYGIHWCVNFVCEPAGSASAVLIRALQPTAGLAAMRRRRGLTEERLLCSGPGRLTEALGITHAQNGRALDEAPFELRARAGAVDVIAGPRI